MPAPMLLVERLKMGLNRLAEGEGGGGGGGMAVGSKGDPSVAAPLAVGGRLVGEGGMGTMLLKPIL